MARPTSASDPRTAPDSDTSAAAATVMFAIYREMPAWRKVALVDDAIRAERQLGLAGLRRRHPEASAAELRRRLLGLVLGAELAERIYGPVPRGR